MHMALRAYLSPVDLVEKTVNGQAQIYYEPRAATLAGTATHINFVPSNDDGTPAGWGITVVRDGPWSTIEAGTDVSDLFAGDLPASVVDRDTFRDFCKGRTIGNIPTARRNAIQAVLDAHGVPTTDFTLSTPLWLLWRRVVAWCLHVDRNFGAHWGV